MIHFFRKIRAQLLANGKIGRYMAYAIGEIVLVVVGILIALAINNFKERRAIEVKEKTYLQGLKDEFEVNSLKLEELIKVNRRNFDEAKAVLGYMDQPDSLASEEVLSELLIGAFSNDLAYNPNNSLLLEMINSGSLKDLRNPDLRRKLTNWLAWMDDIARQEEDLAQQRKRILDLFSNENYSLRTVFDQAGITSDYLEHPPLATPASNLSLLNSTTFENNLLIFISTTRATEKAHYLPLMEDLRNILGLIEGELQDG